MSRSASCAARAARPLSPAERWSAITVARRAVVADALQTRRRGRNNLAVAQIVARLDPRYRALILGDDPTVLSREARLSGRWVHAGRVNRRRQRRRLAGHVDSVDGTRLALGPDRNISPPARWLDELAAQPALL